MLTHNLIHRSDVLHRDAGTFYSGYYEDSERVFSLFDSYCWMGQLLLGEAVETASLFYRRHIPALHRDLIYPVTITEQDYLEGRQRWFHYGSDNAWYGQHLRYGLPAHDIAGVVPLPEGIMDVDICTDMPIDPSVVLLQGIDFEVRKEHLLFYQNVFDILPSEGQEPHRTCTFYLRSAYSDRKYIQDRLGVLTKTHGESTEAYRDFCNLIVDSVIEGTSAARLMQIICKIFDIPCTETTETVEVVENDYLVTDKRVYFSSPHATFLYQAGDTVLPGTILTDAASYVSHKQLPKGLPLFLERRFLGNDYLSGLYFPNETCRVLYTGDAWERAVFPVVGRQEDVERFWRTFHERVSRPELLKQISLGGWINPAEFIYENVLYPRVRLFYVDMAKTGGDRLPMVNTKVLRSLLPPGIIFSLQVAMPPVSAQEVCALVRGTAGIPARGMQRLTANMPDFSWVASAKACE